ncbi:MAG: hypothetical protein ACK519_09650 [Sphingomonadaceae bacterium]
MKKLFMSGKKIGFVSLVVPLMLGCSSEPRSIAYFEKNVAEARAVVADTGECSGIDRTKVMAGSDECTNAHIALELVEVAKKNKRRYEKNMKSLEDGSWLPRAGN